MEVTLGQLGVAHALPEDLSVADDLGVPSLHQRSDEERATEAGFDAHLVKPISVEDLERTLAKLLRSR